MRDWAWYLTTAGLFARALAAPPAQVPLREGYGRDGEDDVEHVAEKQRPLHGRFLQITGER